MAIIKWVDALAEAKKRKDDELNSACKQAILDGFIHNIDGQDYWFSFDAEAQSNFQGSRPLLKEGLVLSINWTVKLGGKNGDYVRIPVDSKIMDDLTIAMLNHKDSKISKYREELLPKVYSAKTIDEINSINWNSEV